MTDNNKWNKNCIKKSNLKRVEAAIRIKRKAKYSTFDRKWKKLADKLKNLQNDPFDDHKKQEALKVLKEIDKKLDEGSKGLHFLGVFTAKKWREQRKEIKDQLNQMIKDIKKCEPKRERKIYLRELMPKHIRNTLLEQNKLNNYITKQELEQQKQELEQQRQKYNNEKKKLENQKQQLQQKLQQQLKEKNNVTVPIKVTIEKNGKYKNANLVSVNWKKSEATVKIDEGNNVKIPFVNLVKIINNKKKKK